MTTNGNVSLSAANQVIKPTTVNFRQDNQTLTVSPTITANPVQ